METTAHIHTMKSKAAEDSPKWAIDGVPSASIADVWPTVWPILKTAVDVAPEDVRFREDELLRLLIEREMQLWVIMNLAQHKIVAAAVTSIIDVDKFMPGAKALEIPFVAGSDMSAWVRALETLLAKYGQVNGAQYLFGYGRKGWERMAEFKSIGYTESGIRVMAKVIKGTMQ